MLVTTGDGNAAFKNAAGYLDTRGMETNLRLTYGNFKLFVGYTYTDANRHDGRASEWLPLTARHRFNNVLMYEVEDKWKLGLEAYYYSRQQLFEKPVVERDCLPRCGRMLHGYFPDPSKG